MSFPHNTPTPHDPSDPHHASQADDRAVPREVLHVPAGGGESVWLNGDAYSVLLDKEQSNGQLALLEASVPPGGGPPLHNHTHEDEAFYLLDGQLEIFANDRTYEVKAGDFVFIPRGTYHRFRNSGVHTARQLVIFAPGGFERFFLEAGKPAVAGTPIPHFDPSDNPKAVEVGARYGSFQASVA
ncbi:quercetin 2,3-dioxygenase [Streptomyces sp. NBC_00237]|uniref:quercetin 2,3-dioxygenase n=1 Tax=Streptomyces sp. NBC_00237 TaxID=2975687 RepID=UPI0022571FFB|nr:quercetin 2,3-dioxygenase [Streptomyces sp. NBC_00237]MCX5206713.1 quercetin 2,3-dioxygenase [Streptomyces sp. NBC_00237]